MKIIIDFSSRVPALALEKDFDKVFTKENWDYDFIQVNKTGRVFVMFDTFAEVRAFQIAASLARPGGDLDYYVFEYSDYAFARLKI